MKKQNRLYFQFINNIVLALQVSTRHIILKLHMFLTKYIGGLNYCISSICNV